MKTQVIVKTHEIALKGKNRPWFMRHLVNNLRMATKGTGVSKVWQGHMLVGLSLKDESSWPEVRDRVRECFGVAKFFKAYELPVDLDKLKEVLPDLLSDRQFQSFRISAHRSDKRFPVTSEEINRDLGTFVIDLTQDGPDGDPKTQRADLTTALETTTFVEVTFKDDSGGTRNIYADLVAPELEEQTGSNETGTITVTAIEKLAAAL